MTTYHIYYCYGMNGVTEVIRSHAGLPDPLAPICGYKGPVFIHHVALYSRKGREGARRASIRTPWFFLRCEPFTCTVAPPSRQLKLREFSIHVEDVTASEVVYYRRLPKAFPTRVSTLLSARLGYYFIPVKRDTQRAEKRAEAPAVVKPALKSAQPSRDLYHENYERMIAYATAELNRPLPVKKPV